MQVGASTGLQIFPRHYLAPRKLCEDDGENFVGPRKNNRTALGGTFSFFKRNFRNILSAGKEKFDRSPLAKGKKFYQKFCLLTEKIIKKLFLSLKFFEWENCTEIF